LTTTFIAFGVIVNFTMALNCVSLGNLVFGYRTLATSADVTVRNKAGLPV